MEVGSVWVSRGCGTETVTFEVCMSEWALEEDASLVDDGSVMVVEDLEGDESKKISDHCDQLRQMIWNGWNG